MRFGSVVAFVVVALVFALALLMVYFRPGPKQPERLRRWHVP